MYILALSMLVGLLSISMLGLADADTWTKKADMPTPRSWLSTSVVNGKIYAIGGGVWVADIYRRLSAVEEYDPATDKWTEKADMPTARSHHATSTVGGKVYAIGGIGNRDGVGMNVEEYDPVTDIWTRKADMPTARRSLSTSVVNGKIYAIGGNVWVRGNKWRQLPTVEEYDPATDTWTKKADMPRARSSHATSTVDGRIYAVGGSDGVIPHLSTVEEYDPVTDTWTKKSDMPTPRYILCTSAVNRRIYAIGGVKEDIGRLSVLEEYDVATDTWVRKADMPTARYGFGASAVGSKIYAIGGKRGLPTVEEYDTGFTGQSTEAKGKLATTWSRLKLEH